VACKRHKILDGQVKIFRPPDQGRNVSSGHTCAINSSGLREGKSRMVDEISKRAITVPTSGRPRDYDHGEGFVSFFPFLSAHPSSDFDRLPSS